MKTKKIEVVVTRHDKLLLYLWDIGLVEPTAYVIGHAFPEDVEGKHVGGILPHAISCLCKQYTEIQLRIPQELWGTDLTIEQIKQFMVGEPVTYKVRRVKANPHTAITHTKGI